MAGEIHNDKLVLNLIELFKTIGYSFPVYYFEMFIEQTKDTYRIYPEDELKTFCDIAFYYPQTKRHLIGIEIKNWQKPVPLTIIKKEYYSYKDTFDLFYLVAKEFTKDTKFLLKCSSEAKEVGNAEFLSNVGLIQIDNDFNLNLLKEASELCPNDFFKGDFLRRLRTNTKSKKIDWQGHIQNQVKRLEKTLDKYGVLN